MGANGLDDHSGSFHHFRPRLKRADGLSYVLFVRSLKPKYWRVFSDIGVGYGALILTVLLCLGAKAIGVPPVLMAALGAVLVGYWVAYIQLFLHEAAHYNLARDRSRSDLLSDVLIGWLVGISIRKYRRVHFQHHKAIGTVDDSEFSYFFPVNIGFFIKSMFGIRALEVLRARQNYLDKSGGERAPRPSLRDYGVFFGGIVAHVVILALLYWIGGLILAASWLLGVGVVFPTLGALRQMLEHRADAASYRVDYTKESHGAFTRMFGDDAFSATFGGAGFNRHLLHHWEPQVSYTNLAELERFLCETEVAPIIEARRTTYARAFLTLFSWY